MPCLTDFLVQNNFLGFLAPLFKTGDWYISQETGKIHKRKCDVPIFSDEAKSQSFPWILHHGEDGSSECAKRFTFFNLFGIIPLFCRTRCYKVVARPRTLTELLHVNDVMRNLGHRGKSGIERRESVPHHYGAYWYCDGEVEGQRIYEKVQESLGSIPVILKRACTEMELKHGVPHQWPEQTESEHYWESMWNELVIFPKDKQNQPDYLKNWIVLGWVRFAWERGDQSVLEHSDGKPLLQGPTNYAK